MESYPRQAAATGQFRYGQPRTFRATTSSVYFLRSTGGRSSALRLHRWDRSTGSCEVILSGGGDAMTAAEQALRERLRESASGITAYDVRRDRVVASAAGRLLLWDQEVGARTLDVQAAYDPRLSPDGQWVSWIEAGALTVCAWDGSGRRVIVDSEDGAHWAVVDFIAAEELQRSRGYWWLPDSTGLLVQRTDDSPVPVWYRANAALPQNEPVAQRYPHAGAANALVELWSFGLDGEGRRLALDGEYLVDAAGGLISTFDRAQTRLQVTDTDGERVCLLEQQPWLDVLPGLPRRVDNRLVAWVDGDHRQLTVDGVAATPADVQIRSFVGAIGDVLYVLACQDPAESRLAKVDGSGFTWLSPASAHASAMVEAGLIVTSEVDWTSSRTVVTIRDGDYGPVAEVDNLAETPVVQPAPVRIPAGRDEVQTVVLWPTDPADGPLPVLMNPYGGPHAQRVLAARNSYASAQWLADQGFCVIIADGRGTPGQSPPWEHSVAGNLRDLALADQVTALQNVAARFPERVDTDRVGILGWSYGGYLAALAVLDRPDVFHAAIAGAPVTEWRLYDTAYTERYLGNPQTDPGPYDHCSLLPLAAQLQRPLLLIHGLADDNVFAAHTLQLSTALLHAGRTHEVLPLAGVTHMTPQPDVAENLLLLQVDFFRRHLG
ncbi:MAG: alpha/beta fold hydrolase [Candidatus Nanopelagicales bacterium]